MEGPSPEKENPPISHHTLGLILDIHISLTIHPLKSINLKKSCYPISGSGLDSFPSTNCHV